ncbi:MAG: hypothetical protein ACRD9L_07715, partial [Bryobacteraceae bacterium]
MSDFRRIAASLILLGVSFGYVEAAIVVYLRTIYTPVRARLHPEVPAADLFPLITPQQLAAEGAAVQRLLPIELVREAATLVMLMAAGLAVARNGRQWVAAFAVAMGVWDVFFYVFLKVLIGWPASLFTWDILFLIPAPWASPVLAPVLVALSMAGGGLAVLRVESAGAVFHATGKHWLGLFVGAAIILVSFLWDAPSLVAGGTPRSFPWFVFAVGEGIALGTFA